jgi:hypothetical protein
MREIAGSIPFIAQSDHGIDADCAESGYVAGKQDDCRQHDSQAHVSQGISRQDTHQEVCRQAGDGESSSPPLPVSNARFFAKRA